MIRADNITLKPPMCMVDQNREKNEEVDSLLDALTEFFSQRNVVFLADLTVSNNEWEDIKGGRKRKDFTVPLNSLVKVEVYSDKLIFSLLDGSVQEIVIGKNFFWFFEWEPAYYD